MDSFIDMIFESINGMVGFMLGCWRSPLLSIQQKDAKGMF
jgi:hypothetical protein